MSTPFHFLRIVQPLVLLIVWVLQQNAFSKDITSAITATNAPTGTLTAPFYLIDSDSANADPAYNRDFIPGTAQVFFSRALGVVSASESFRVLAQLIDEAGAVVPISNATPGAGTNTFASAPQDVSLNFLFPTASRNFQVILKPASERPAGTSYTIRYQVQRITPAVGISAGPTSSDSFVMVHFADLPENTSSRYARGWLRDVPTWTKSFAISSGSGATRQFTVNVPYSLARYDVGGSSLSVACRFIATLTDDLGNTIPLENGGVSTVSFTRNAFTAGTPNTPHLISSTRDVPVIPTAQLDPRNRTYRVTVRFEHLETTPSTYRDNGTTDPSSLQRLLHFNGTLTFGTTNTAFTSVSNTPTAISLGVGFVNTTVNPPSGTIPGFPSYFVGAGGVLDVRLLTNGNAVVTAGTRPIDTTNGLEATYGGIRVSYLGGTLTPTGPIVETATVHLPQGLAYTPNRNTSAGRYLPSIVIPGTRPLTSLFRHTGDLSLALPADAWVFDEARPLLYRVAQFDMPEDGTLRFKGVSSEWVHRAAADQLEAQQAAGQHQNSSMAYRLGNDGYLRFSSIANGDTVAFTRAGDGSVRTQDAAFEVQPGAFHSHFPLDSKLSWSGGGTIKISNGIINPASLITGAVETKVAFDGSCVGDSCGPAPGTAVEQSELRPDGDEWRFTADGGLWATGKVKPIGLKWGIRAGNIPTHLAGEFNDGAFLAPGHQLYAANNPLASGPMAAHSAPLGPAAITLAAVDKELPSQPVYPETVRYRNGVGFYPGVTFTVTDPSQAGASQIADMPSAAPYALQETVSKYYIRRSGISGRHVAVEGTFPDTLQLYGYKFGFSRFQLTFLSNQNVDSWINGGLDVPNPSGFSQRFLGLMLSCTGALESAEIDPDDAGSKPLNYWNGSFTPITIRFAPEEGAGCYASRFLTIGLVSGAANIPTPLAGTLAFLPSGNIGTIADSIVGVDGRLGLPARVPMDGPGNETYQLVPVTKLYFNNPALPGAPASGFVNFAASCDVPFFQDLKVHLMTSAQAGIAAPIHLAGGWTDASQTFFSNNQFDPTHRGFPTATTLANYQSPTAETPYVVRATQSLFGFVDLDYPLKWQSTSRYFESWPADAQDLFVVKVKHQVDYLSANNTELSFGAQYEGLPKINLVSTAFDLADGQLGAARALTNAARQFVTDTLNQGVDEVGNLVNDTMENVLDQAIDSIEDEVITPLYTAVVQSYNTAAAANTSYGAWVNTTTGTLKLEFDRYLNGSIGIAANSVKGRLQQLGDAGTEASNIVSRVSSAVDAGILAIDSVVGRIQIVNGQPVFNEIIPAAPTIPSTDPTPVINGIISGILAEENGPGGMERQIVQKLVGQLISQLAPPDLATIINPLLADLTSELNGELNQLLSEFDPTLDRITEVLLEARGYLVIVKGKLAAGQDIITSFNQIVTNASAEIDAIVASIRSTAYTFINSIAASATYGPTTVLNSAGNLINEFDQEEFVALLRAHLRDRLLATEFIQQIQYTLRQYISELDMAMRSAIDSAFNEVSRMCKELIKSALGPIDDAINGLVGDVNKYVGAGSVDGYAHIQGDTLRRLRLDAKVELKIPDDLRLQAFIEINCYDSSTTTGSAGCLAAGEQLLEVKIGALDVPLDWISPDMRADLSVWFSMQTSPTPIPKGIGGALTMTGGELDFQSLKITGFGASVAIGLDEAYIAATARLIVSSYEASGGIFFGRTCTLTPLLIVDPDAASILGSPPFTGAYVYGEVWIPISEVVLGIPASCLFRISAGVGAGAFFFVEGPTFGGKMLLGVSGEALCIVSIRGEVALTGVMSGGSLRFTGRGTLTGKAGYCPFCVKFKESAKVTYQDGSWSVDF